MADHPGVVDSAQLERVVKSGAGWFYWIAGLSMVNTVMHLSGTAWGFAMGLGISQIVDGIMGALAESLGHATRAYGFFLDVLEQEGFSLGFHGFALFRIFGGYQAHRQLSALERPGFKC